MFARLTAEARRFVWTCIWSWRGWAAAWASEKSLRQWTMANLASVALAFWLPLSAGERGLILALGLVLLAMELMNTAVETLVNMVSPERHPMAAKTKDCASAAVALSAFAAGAAWAMALWRLWAG